MEQPAISTQKRAISVIIIILIVGASLIFFEGWSGSKQEVSLMMTESDNKSDTVTVENTPVVNGAIPVPEGFPQDIPLEVGGLIESAITKYPRENTKQLSVSYLSSNNIAKKYTEYKNYMESTGYQITENTPSSSTKTILGVKEDINLSVVISPSEGKTRVELSYLLK